MFLMSSFKLHHLIIFLRHLPFNMADSPAKSDFATVCPCGVSVRNCLDTLAELKKVKNVNQSTDRDICHLQLLGEKLHWWAARWDTPGVNISASLSPDVQIQCSLSIISGLVNQLPPTYEDNYDETRAIIEQQEMAFSNEAVQKRFKSILQDIVIN